MANYAIKANSAKCGDITKLLMKESGINRILKKKIYRDYYYFVDEANKLITVDHISSIKTNHPNILKFISYEEVMNKNKETDELKMEIDRIRIENNDLRIGLVKSRIITLILLALCIALIV